MSKLTFTDGESFDLSGPLRLEERYDGWYVLGNGRMIPVASKEAGNILIGKPHYGDESPAEYKRMLAEVGIKL
jgi:hypothetical protein